jgi:hypothetical protein
MNRRVYQVLLIVAVTAFVAYLHFYGIDRLVLNSDELFRARALVSSDWDLFKVAWPEHAVREEFNNWPMHLPPVLGILMRAAVVGFGPDQLHLALRFWPAFFGVLGVWAVYAMYRTFHRSSFAWLALILTALASNQMFEFSKSMKHYTMDVVFCSLQYIFAYRFLTQRRTRDAIWLAVISAVGIWVAFGVVFTTAAIFAGLFLYGFRPFSNSKQTRKSYWQTFFATAAIIGISALGLYVLIVQQAIKNPNFIEHISHSGLQLFDWSQAGNMLYWGKYLARAVLHTVRISVFFFRDNWVFGSVANLLILYWIWQNIKSKNYFAPIAFVLPWLLIVLGSFADVFPLQAYRVISFILPAWIVMLTGGVQLVYEKLTVQRGTLAKAFLGLFILATVGLSFLNIRDTFYLRFGGGRKVDKAMKALMDHAQDQDTVFLHWGAILPFYIYATDHQPGYLEQYPIKRSSGGSLHVIYGNEHRNRMPAYEEQFREVEKVPGRLWVAFCHNWPSEDMLALKSRLTAQRQLLNTYDFKKCQVLLFAPLPTTR